MKIAHIGTKGLPSKGGAERVVEAVVKRLTARHEITVYCSSRYTPADAQVLGVRLVRVPSLPGKYTHITSVNLLAALHAVLLSDFDLVHVHNIEASLVIPLLKARYRVIATAHGLTYKVEKWPRLIRRMIRLTEYLFIYLADARTSVSQPHAKMWEQRYNRKVHYIPNGIEGRYRIDQQPASAFLHDYEVGDDGYVLFAAGRIIPAKGCHLLLEAFRDLSSDLDLVAIGDLAQVPAYRRQLQEMAASDERVRFIPFVSSKSRLMAIVKAARLFVFPSVNEAMSMMLLEAAALGVPVVCSDIPANRAVLPQHALFFNSGRVGDLRDKLAWALRHPDEMQELGDKAKAWVMEHYHWNTIAQRYEALYQELGTS